MLHDDFGSELDLSMLVRREKVPGHWTPEGILTRFEKTSLGRLTRQIEDQPSQSTIL